MRISDWSSDVCSSDLAKGDVVELHPAADRRQCHAAAGQLGAGVEDVAEALDRDAHLLEILPQLRQTDDRRRHLPGQHVEGDQLAERQLAFDHQLGAKEKHRNRHPLSSETRRVGKDCFSTCKYKWSTYHKKK